MSILRSFSAGMVVQLLGILASLATQVVGARLLGVSSFGRYVSLVAVANFVVVFAKLERDSVVVRFVSAAESPRRAASVIRWAVVRTAQQSVIVGGIVGVAYSMSSAAVALNAASTILGLTLAVIGTSLIAVCTAVFQSTNRAVTGLTYPNVLRPLLLLALFALLGASAIPQTEIAFFIANGVAAVVTLGVMLWKLDVFSEKTEFPRDSEVLHRAGVSITAISFAQILLSTQLDVLVLARVAQSSEVGRYAAAAQFAALAALPTTILAAVTMAKFSSLFQARDTARLLALSKAFTLSGFVSSAGISVCLVAAAEPILNAIGRDFKPDMSVLLLLCSAQVVSASIGVQSGYLLTMTGRHEVAARLIAVAAAVNVALLFVGASQGPVGVAWATLVGTSVRGFLLLLAVRRQLGMNIFPSPSTFAHMSRHLRDAMPSRN